MNTNGYQNSVLSDNETLQMLQGFCNEALRFMKVPADKYPLFAIGGAIGSTGKVDPLVIEYQQSKVLISIPFFKMLLTDMSGNDAPTWYRMIGYQLARFWYRFLNTGAEDAINPMDKDSLVFASALSILKGIRVTPGMPTNLVLDMIKNEFGIECELVEGFEITSKTRQKIIRPSTAGRQKISDTLNKLIAVSDAMPLATISDGQLGSESNPFANVDEAAAYIKKIEEVRLSSDPFRQAISSEEYFFDGQAFRISWASANVSYYPIEGIDKNGFVVSQLSTHNKFVLKPVLTHNKFLYRGQAEFYSPCKPSLYREKKDYFVDDIIQMNELKCLLKTHPLVQLFEQGFELFHDTFHFKINYDGLSQHYYNNTSWLDLTSDMDVAKFFAVTTFNMKKDCYEKYKGDKLGVLYYFDLKSDSFRYSDKRNYVVDNIGKQPFMRSGNQSGFLVNVGKDDDFNNYPEVRYVFFRHDSDITDRIFSQFNDGDIIMPEEILRSHWYARMNDDSAKKIVSTEALKLNYADNPHESHNKIIKALRSKKFKIKNYHPSFTEEELDQYYAKSLESWQKFCSNIHFFGPEGFLMKKHLINLPNDPRYKWAFVKDR